MRQKRFLVTTVAAIYFGALAGLAFVPGSVANRAFWFWPFAAFVPVGVLLLLMLGRRRWWAAIGFAVLGAAWIEAAQTVWMPVGYASAIHVLWAGLGASAGVVLALVAATYHAKSMRAHESHRIVPHAGRREIPQD